MRSPDLPTARTDWVAGLKSARPRGTKTRRVFQEGRWKGVTQRGCGDNVHILLKGQPGSGLASAPWVS